MDPAAAFCRKPAAITLPFINSLEEMKRSVKLLQSLQEIRPAASGLRELQELEKRRRAKKYIIE